MTHLFFDTSFIIALEAADDHVEVVTEQGLNSLIRDHVIGEATSL